MLGMAIGGCAVLAWLAYAWARDSSLVKVDEVEISGLTTEDAPAIRKALTYAAKDMTTLHIDGERLEAAVEGYPVVRSVSASADFPDKLRIDVQEYRPSAVVSDPGGRRVAVAADGTLLPRVDDKKLPVVKVSGVSTSDQLGDSRAASLVELLGAAPRSLRPKLERAYWGKQGVRVVVRDGPVIVFGQPSAARAKWRAAARVLADPSSAGAESIDVRLPERPAAAGFEQQPPPEATTSETPPPGTEPAPVEPATAPEAPPAPAEAAPLEPQP
jgi:cell division protein FtsQ